MTRVSFCRLKMGVEARNDTTHFDELDVSLIFASTSLEVVCSANHCWFEEDEVIADN